MYSYFSEILYLLNFSESDSITIHQFVVFKTKIQIKSNLRRKIKLNHFLF